jgi:hypothetical protein
MYGFWEFFQTSFKSKRKLSRGKKVFNLKGGRRDRERSLKKHTHMSFQALKKRNVFL